MLSKLVQATSITFLLTILAHMNPPDANQPTAVSPSPVSRNLLVGLR